jgi:hypothetical protein
MKNANTDAHFSEGKKCSNEFMENSQNEKKPELP